MKRCLYPPFHIYVPETVVLCVLHTTTRRFSVAKNPSVILPLLVVHLQAWLLKLGQISERNKICRSSEMCILLGHGRSRDPRESEREVWRGHNLPGRSYLSNDEASGCHPALLNGRYRLGRETHCSQPKPCHRTLLKALSQNLAQSFVTELCSKPCHRTLLKTLSRNLAQRMPRSESLLD